VINNTVQYCRIERVQNKSIKVDFEVDILTKKLFLIDCLKFVRSSEDRLKKSSRFDFEKRKKKKEEKKQRRWIVVLLFRIFFV
jgi:hypothetical protein